MGPRKSTEKDELDTSKKITNWNPEFIQFAIYVCTVGTRTEIVVDGRKTDLFTLEGINSRGFKYIIQVWGVEAIPIEEYFK